MALTSDQLRRSSTTRQLVPLALFATVGIWFWFLVGFPFANHNESYDWVVGLEQLDFQGALRGYLPAVVGLRPLATTLAWLLYRLGGHSIVPVELLNCFMTLMAWITLVRGAPQQRLASLLAVVTCGVLFSGYLYLFHLHGIFYGPLLLLLAHLITRAHGRLELHDLRRDFLLCLVLALLHPFALVFYVAMAVASPVQFPRLRTPAALGWILFSCALAVLVARLLVPPGRWSPLELGPAALASSFRNVEVHALVSITGLALAAMTAVRTWPGWSGRLAALGTLALGAIAMRAQLPVLPLWVFLCLLRSVWAGRWILASLIAASSLLPVASPTGSPTYTVFALMLCAAVTALDGEVVESRLAWLGPAAQLGVAVVAALTALALRSGAPIPVLSQVARPLLAEREHTFQLERLIDDVLRSSWREHAVRFYRESASPVMSGNALNREHRPPTQQLFLDHFLTQRRGHEAAVGETLIVTFGDESVPGAERVLSVAGRFAGQAAAYRMSNAASLRPGR